MTTPRALGLCALTLALAASIAAPARAIEIELPAERTMDLNGFWELRLQFLGDDWPANGTSLSQFRHVLNLETEIELFPDGVGVFDFMMMYSRFIVTYDCAYQRGEGSGCIVPGFDNMDALFNSANHYGGEAKDIDRLPRNLRNAKSGEIWPGGVIQSRFVPGTLRANRQRLNKTNGFETANSVTNTIGGRVVGHSRRYRDSINQAGELQNPNPLAFLFNSVARSKLDPPIGTEFTPNYGRVRAGSYNEKVHLQYLQASRARLGANFQTLFGDKFLGGQFLNVQNNDEEPLGNAQLRALNSVIARSGADDPNRVVVSDGAGNVVDTQTIVNKRDRMLFPTECPAGDPDCAVPDENKTVENAQLDYFTIDPGYLPEYQLDSSEALLQPNLLDTRPDATKQFPGGTFQVLSERTGNEGLVSAQWGSHQLSDDRVVPYLATLDTKIYAFGYFTGSETGVNAVQPFDVGITRDINQIDNQTQCVDGIEDPCVPLSLPPENGNIDQAQLRRKLVPAFFGADGVRNSLDDLPNAQLLGQIFGAQEPDIPNGAENPLAIDPFGAWLGNSSIVVDGQQRAVQRFARVLPIPDPEDPSEMLLDPRFGQTTAQGVPFTFQGREDAENAPLVLYGEYDDLIPLERGCTLLGGSLSEVAEGEFSCTGTGDPSLTNAKVLQRGCKDVTRLYFRGGINADGKCIQMNVVVGTPTVGGTSSAGVNARLIEALGRASLRPQGADNEPIDLTDIVAFGEKTEILEDGSVRGRAPPARPRSPKGGLYYESIGFQQLFKDTDGLFSNLDLNYDVDELRWGHGASEDEHEFREGYVEFEMFDSQLWARLGKLIMVWGKTELFRNQDRLNPVDLSNGVISRLEEARVGQWAAQFVISPEAFMRVGPVEDMRLELVTIVDDFEPTDLGKCGESTSLALVCLKGFGAYAHGLIGIGVAGERRPYDNYSGTKRWDFGARIEGRWDRFTFAITDFYGWDDGFYLDVTNRYLRRVDPNTGAPVRGAGALDCKYRTNFGSSADPTRSLGPDGVQGTQDDLIPSVGNCLLWDNPEGDEAQELRASDAIANTHYANQTLFHTVCAATFDPDQGFCAFDRLTNPDQFALIAGAFSGGDSTVARLAISGARSLRSGNDKFAAIPFQNIQDFIFAPVSSGVTDPDAQTLQFDSQDDARHAAKAALLGCGPSFASACGGYDLRFIYQEPVNPSDFSAGFEDDGSVEADLRLDDVTEDLPGGVDFMNADASVMTQDFTVLKGAAQPKFSFDSSQAAVLISAKNKSALVGTRNRDFDALGNNEWPDGLRYEPGITLAGLMQMDFAQDSVTGEYLFIQAADPADQGELNDLLDILSDTNAVADLTLVERSELVNQVVILVDDPSVANYPTDGWIEPLPWKLDEDSIERGEILYKVANMDDFDPRCDPDGRPTDGETGDPIFSDDEVTYCQIRANGWTPGTASLNPVLNDPTDPTNPLNDFIDDYNLIADVCHPFASRSSQIGQDQDTLDQLIDAGLLAPDAPGAVAFDMGRGCTELERFSANLERFLITLNIIGLDNQFDPPETVEEILAMTDGDWANDAFGDPIAGPDGVFTLNKEVFVTDRYDVQVLENAGNEALSATALFPDEFAAFVAENEDDPLFPQDQASREAAFLADTEFEGSLGAQGFFEQYSHDSCQGTSCFLAVPSLPGDTPDRNTGGRNLIGALPTTVLAKLDQDVFDDPCVRVGRVTRCNALDTNRDGKFGVGDEIPISMLYLSVADDGNGDGVGTREGQYLLSLAFSGQSTEINTLFDQPGDGGLNEFINPDNASCIKGDVAGQFVCVDGEGFAFEDLVVPVKLDKNVRTELLLGPSADLNNDQFGTRDLDQDNNGIWDGADDWTRGPVSDDGILCGSGIPGDVLQDAAQFDLMSVNEEEFYEEVFGENPNDRDGTGLPFRSPTYCGGVTGLVGAAAQTLPFKLAEGDGTWGRRDFLWHGGQELAFDYQKTNVFGFALDFAEDRTKTSWGIETSWAMDVLVPNTKSFTGLSETDIIVMSISIDRPTFFNFLNPNRSFFLNFQFFMQYITDFEGGKEDHDGMYGLADSAFSVPIVTFTFFTGYFQDRLAPRTTFVWSPETATAGFLWGLSYRWSGNFTTSLAMNQFFGDANRIQRPYFPALSYGDTKLDTGSNRGLYAVTNRDTVFFNVRYSW